MPLNRVCELNSTLGGSHLGGEAIDYIDRIDNHTVLLEQPALSHTQIHTTTVNVLVTSETVLSPGRPCRQPARNTMLPDDSCSGGWDASRWLHGRSCHYYSVQKEKVKHCCLTFRIGGQGWIRTNELRRRADLQSAGFNHLHTYPCCLVEPWAIEPTKFTD